MTTTTTAGGIAGLALMSGSLLALHVTTHGHAGAADASRSADLGASLTAAGAPGPAPAAERLNGDCLQDNGDTDGSNAYSNGTANAFGARRTLLDDFVVPAGQGWFVRDFKHRHVWNELPPGSGTGMDIVIRDDNSCVPGNIVIQPFPGDYTEVATGRVFFSRDEAESSVSLVGTFQTLGPGRYWIEASIIGPENNFWLTRADVTGKECWIDYDDFNGLESGTAQFGVPADLNWCLSGDVDFSCGSDLNWDYQINFEDILAILGVWGQVGHPFDLDGSGVVDFGDILQILPAWGPCPFGACCFADSTCFLATEDQCAAEFGTYLGDDVSCDECAPTGACCVSPDCFDATEQDCIGQGGSYLGDDIPCTDAIGACCLGTIFCEELSEVDCLAQGGNFFLGCGTQCDGEFCPGGIGP